MAVDARFSNDGPTTRVQATWTRSEAARLDVLHVRSAAREWAFVARGRVVLEPLSEGIELLTSAARAVPVGAAIVTPEESSPIRIRARAQAEFRVMFEARAVHATDTLRFRLHAPRVCPTPAADPADVFRCATAGLSRGTSESFRIEPALARARRHIEEHVGEDFDLATLGSLMAIDRHHLCRTFRRAFGLPPYRFRNHLRLAHARELLAAGLDCTAVAHAVGFCDQSHLTRVFKDLTGTTPGSYVRAVTPAVVSSAA